MFNIEHAVIQIVSELDMSIRRIAHKSQIFFNPLHMYHREFKYHLRSEMVGDPGIEPGVRLREGVTVPCHTLRPVAHCQKLVAPNVEA